MLHKYTIEDLQKLKEENQKKGKINCYLVYLPNGKIISTYSKSYAYKLGRSSTKNLSWYDGCRIYFHTIGNMQFIGCYREGYKTNSQWIYNSSTRIWS